MPCRKRPPPVLPGNNFQMCGAAGFGYAIGVWKSYPGSASPHALRAPGESRRPFRVEEEKVRSFRLRSQIDALQLAQRSQRRLDDAGLLFLAFQRADQLACSVQSVLQAVAQGFGLLDG